MNVIGSIRSSNRTIASNPTTSSGSSSSGGRNHHHHPNNSRERHRATTSSTSDSTTNHPPPNNYDINSRNDRSHPNLMKLDAIVSHGGSLTGSSNGGLTYEGWQTDFQKAEKAHFDGNDYSFHRLIQVLVKKQTLHDGDRSHPRIVALDQVIGSIATTTPSSSARDTNNDTDTTITSTINNTTSPSSVGVGVGGLTYPGHEEDIAILYQSHYDWEEPGTDFWDLLQGLRNKQKIYEGDRSHPNLVELDSIVSTLQYDGWEMDYRKAENAHNDGFTWGFDRMIQKMKKKQTVYSGDRSHPRLVALDEISATLTYPGHEDDVLYAEEIHYDWEEAGGWNDFWETLQGLRNKQCIYVGDRSHPNLVQLDRLIYYGPPPDDDDDEEEYTTTNNNSSDNNNNNNNNNNRGTANNNRRRTTTTTTTSSSRHNHTNTASSSSPNNNRSFSRSTSSRTTPPSSTSNATSNHVTAIATATATSINSSSTTAVPSTTTTSTRTPTSLTTYLTYPGWLYDVQKAEDAHKDGFDWGFQRRYQKIKKKQLVFLGIRTHPQLEALDELAAQLTYPGYLEDIQEAEQIHFDWEEGSDFWDKLQGMKNRQQFHHPTADGRTGVEVSSSAVNTGRIATASSSSSSSPSFAALPHALRRRNTSTSSTSSNSSRRNTTIINRRNNNNNNSHPRTKRKKKMKQQQPRNDECSTANNDCDNDNDENKTASIPDLLGVCIICREEQKSHSFVPCGHLCVCEYCANLSLEAYGSCPICRTASTQTIRVFFS